MDPNIFYRNLAHDYLSDCSALFAGTESAVAARCVERTALFASLSCTLAQFSASYGLGWISPGNIFDAVGYAPPAYAHSVVEAGPRCRDVARSVGAVGTRLPGLEAYEDSVLAGSWRSLQLVGMVVLGNSSVCRWDVWCYFALCPHDCVQSRAAPIHAATRDHDWLVGPYGTYYCI